MLEKIACVRRVERLRRRAVVRRVLEGFQECFNSTKSGHRMPAFIFEKISPPVRRGPIAPIVKKQRGLIAQILGSFVEARAKKTRAGSATSARDRNKRSSS